jgi:transcriptional regulator GlxA family with amidase domain
VEDAQLLDWVRARAQDTELMMSVCNGALVYGAAGLLEGLEVTTHRSALQSLALLEPTARVHTNRRFVDNGRVHDAAAGVSAGIDGALHVVAASAARIRPGDGALHGVRLAARRARAPARATGHDPSKAPRRSSW